MKSSGERHEALRVFRELKTEVQNEIKNGRRFLNAQAREDLIKSDFFRPKFERFWQLKHDEALPLESSPERVLSDADIKDFFNHTPAKKLRPYQQ